MPNTSSNNALYVYVGEGGLQVSYNGGVLFISGSLVTVSAGTIAVTKNTTNYVYLLYSNNTVTANTSGFPSACFPMATVVVDNERPTTITDSRADFVTPVSDQGTFVSDVFKSSTANPASAGVLRLAKSDAIKWRNNLNSADVGVSLNASDEIELPAISLTSTVRWPAATSVSSDVIDFSNITRADNMKYIRMGTYASPVPFNGTGLFQAYSLDTANGGAGYLFFFTMRGTGSDELIGIQMTVESRSILANAPNKVKGLDMLVALDDVTSVLATAGSDHTAGMFGGHFKVWSVDGATCAAGSRVAALWLDGQMNGANASPVSANYYDIYATSGGNAFKAFAMLHLISGEGAGWTNLFSFNFNTGTPPLAASGTYKTPQSNDAAFFITVDKNGTPFGIPCMAV